jgi:hypothetical protein
MFKSSTGHTFLCLLHCFACTRPNTDVGQEVMFDVNLIENSTLGAGLDGWSPVGDRTKLSVHEEEPANKVPTETINDVPDEYRPSGRYILASGRAAETDGLCRRAQAPGHVPRGRLDQRRRRGGGRHRPPGVRRPPRRRRLRRPRRGRLRRARQVDGGQGRVPPQGEPLRRRGVRPGRARRRRREGDGPPGLCHGPQGAVQEAQEED